MNKVLLVGNGFDLAHGLLTSYGNFLELMQCWKTIYTSLQNENSGGIHPENDVFTKYVCNARNMNMDNLAELDRIIKRNSWVNYFCNCEAEIDGWIDFEKEIYPVIRLFEYIFSSDDKIENGAILIKDGFGFEKERIASLWNRYIDTDGIWIYIEEEFRSEQYGILKKKILQSLRDEFDEFIKAFEIYLLEFVHGVEHSEVLEQIKNIKADYVISFNYTHTEEWYGVNKDKVHHLHGVIREDVKEDKGKNVNGQKNNMVMGVNEQKDQNIDFIYFVKYFQRIQKASGTKYKDFTFVKYQYELHIYGHSLDETDEDILKNVIGSIDVNAELSLKPKKVFIYYYDAADYEQKVINLIKLYGRSVVERQMEKKSFEFILTDTTKCRI